MKKRYIGLVVIFFIVISCVAFGRITSNDFVDFDDTGYIIENPHIKTGINLQTIKWAFSSVVLSNWHPLTLISFMLDWRLFGANAGGHHLVSLLLHIGATVFLFLFLYKTTRGFWPAVFAAAFFAVHPLRVESVAWASERKDVLSMFFGMASLYSYAFYAEGSSKRFAYVLCLALFVLSLMSKPMLVTLPLILMLLDYWPLKRWPKTPPASAKSRYTQITGLVWEKTPFILLSLASCMITFWAQNQGDVVASVAVLPLFSRAANAIVSYVAYLEKIFWPFNLSVFYPYQFDLPLWKIAGTGSILILITIAVFYWRKSRPFLFTGWFWYLGTMIPVIGLIQIGTQAMADRYTYLPSVGISLMLAWGIPSWIKSKNMHKMLLFPTAFALIAVLSVLTRHQCGYWTDSITLFNHALRVTENNGKIHYHLAQALFENDDVNKAIYHYDRAIDLTPEGFGYYYYYCNRARAYEKTGRYQEALEDYDTALRLKPDCAEAYYNRGIIYGKSLGRYELALNDFNEAIRRDVDYIKAYNNRGLIYILLGRYHYAIQDFSKAISLKPDYADAYNNRAFAYLKTGGEQACYRDARKACELGNCKMLK